MIKLGLYGCGKLNKIVAKCYKEGLLEGYEIVGCYSKTAKSREEMASYLGIEKCDTYDEMLQRGISYVVEATNPKATIDILEKTLNKKINVKINAKVKRDIMNDKNIILIGEQKI